MEPGWYGAEVARRFVARRRPHRLPWRWDGAIAAFGLARLSAPRGLAFVGRYLRHHAGRAKVATPDHCAPALAAVAARDSLTEHAFAEATTPVATFLRTQPRNRLGALDHLGVGTLLRRVYPASIWIDSLMMYAATAVALGRALDDGALRDFGSAQPRIFAEVLQDPDTDLFRHAYLEHHRRPRPRTATFWLRGNGWVAAALADMLEHEHPSRADNLAIFERLTHALLEHQCADGLWPTVLGHPWTYREASGSALVAYGLAKGSRLGLLGPEALVAAMRTFAALTNSLRQRPDGLSLPGTSGPTIPGPRLAYALVPRFADVDYGVGAFCLLAAELSLHGAGQSSLGSA